MNRYICIHGHFYQPPRENPWTGVIEEQKSADPYHDWNERITAECYDPNAHTQILNNQNQPLSVTNNYSSINFNIGPTLLSWLEHFAPDTYQSILEADRNSVERFSGHGSAIAQVYNHIIMPLANDRDKQTQVIWGIKDFEHRFKRRPEGMWLSETAVNIQTLEVLAEFRIAYTILAPSQAKCVREIGDEFWMDTKDSSIDTQMPYICHLPSGKKITLFFYDGQIANEVAFGTLLKNGVNFANQLVATFPFGDYGPRLAHIANDGETYGHHHMFGNMALAYMIHHVESNDLAIITNYGEFLEKNPPTHEVQIIEDSSWSCFHGVERWKAHCGCQIDLKSKWSQKWREHLRNALDWLRDELAPIFENELSAFYSDPWAVRDHYITELLNQSTNDKDSVLWKIAKQELSGKNKERIIKLLEMQRHAMLMYTSCGWFFDDISGLESVQILQYAARALQLARETTDKDLEEDFMGRLSDAKSNIPEMKDGKVIYERFVKTAMPTSK